MSETPNGSIVVRTDGDLETIEEVGDVVQITPNKLKIVYTDTSEDLLTGTLFGAWGAWKMWLDPPDKSLQKYQAQSPLTMGNYVQFTQYNATFQKTAPIKRLKQQHL